MSIAPPPPENFIQSLRSRIVEGRTFTPDQYRPIIIPLQVGLGATRTSGSATYVIPSNQRFLLTQFVPIIVPIDVSDVLDSVTGAFIAGIPAPGDVFAGGTVEDRLYAKAQNCRISLSLVSDTFQLFPQFSFSLGDLMAENGASSLVDMPGIIPQGTTINMLASLSDASAVGGDTQYGLVLMGVFINV